MRVVDEILERILGIESEARAVFSEAQELATMLKEQAQEEADELRTRAREKAHQEAEALRQEVEQEVEKERSRILSQGNRQDRPVQEMEHFEKAVRYVVDVVSEQREGKA